MGKYINPFTDWGFKRLFGQEFSKPLLISFLNDLLVDELHVKDLTFRDKELLPPTKDQRGIIDQVDKGRTESEDAYKFLPVYTICFMNYMPRTDEVSKFRTDIVLADKDTKMQVSNKIRFIYLALPLFKNKAEECVTDFEKWIYVLKHMEALSRMPFTAQKEIFKQLEDYADSHRLTKKEWEAYENSLWVVRDNMACMAAAEREARDKGHAEGRAEGRAEEKKTIARNLLAMGLTIEQVAQGSGLPIEEVKSLQ